MYEKWNVPSWSVADWQIINGRNPRDFSSCHDPAGSRIYLGLKAKASLQDRIFGIKRTSRSWSRLKNNIRARIQATSVLGCSRNIFENELSLYYSLGHAVYKYASENDCLTEPANIKIPGISRLSDVLPDWQNYLMNYHQELSSTGGLLIVHGSQADQSTTPYSDIDLLIVGDITNSSHHEIKHKIEQLILEIDPLQHHGVFFVDKSSLKAYWQMQLPIQVLKRSLAFDATGALLTINIIREPYGSIAAARGMLYSLEWLLSMGESTGIGLWKWKYLLSQLMLLPTLVLGAGGVYVYKADSFLLAKDLYSIEAWLAIEEATRVRVEWPKEYPRQYYLDQAGRINGKITIDPATVHSGIALWKDQRFTKALKKFIIETKKLLNLEV